MKILNRTITALVLTNFSHKAPYMTKLVGDREDNEKKKKRKRKHKIRIECVKTVFLKNRTLTIEFQ